MASFLPRIGRECITAPPPNAGSIFSHCRAPAKRHIWGQEISMFSFFERRIDPYPADEPSRPPEGLV
ncbi:MAG: hypothetical protein VYD64_04635, partial [Pseudomonadota bacterium]|nr:hypothetical protein [Pseudomonadota bacterium]